MPVYLDDETVRLDGKNLGGILTAAQRRIDSSGRVIVEVQLDGRSLVGDELVTKQQESIADGELRLYTADPKILSIGVLEQARLALDQARQCQENAAERFQQDQPVEAMEQITLALDIWQQTRDHAGEDAMLVTGDWYPMHPGLGNQFDTVEHLESVPVIRFGIQIKSYDLYRATVYHPLSTAQKPGADR